MKDRYILTSMTRISDLGEIPFSLEPLARNRWATGDYVAAEVLGNPSPSMAELASGRMVELTEGDVVVGALGHRHATLEATGSWEAVEGDGIMELLTGGGLMGRCTSRSSLIPPLCRMRYSGHVARDGQLLEMENFVPQGPEPAVGPPQGLNVPAVMIIGTSMSAGKTAAARVVIRRLRQEKQRVLAGKVTGASRYRDILTMADSGAESIFDFVDMGLPSTICPPREYGRKLEGLLARMSDVPADTAVIEVGASPLEPYNGAGAVRRISESVKLTILCASDPYAVLGIMEAFDLVPDLVTGITSNTLAGVELVEKLTRVRCLNLRDARSHAPLDDLLRARGFLG